MTKEKTQTETKDQIESLLASKEFEGKHYGQRFGESFDDSTIITTSSYFMDYVLGGGYRSSSWARVYADPECGKTSMMLVWGRNWQNRFPDNGQVVIFNAEGRMTKDLVDRSGINTDKSKFRIIDMNLADSIFDLISKLVDNNPNETRYYFGLDSTDACTRLVDEGKTFGDSEKMSGGAVIASMAGKRLSLPFNRKGHFLFLSSQVRDKINKGGMAAGGKEASGGNAPKFYSSLICSIQKPWTETYIYDDPSDTKSKIVGRMATIKLIKTYNETSGQTVQYPVKYGLTGGVWSNFEAMMIAQTWGFYKKAGIWWKIAPEFAEELKANNLKFEESFQGERNMRNSFDENIDLSNYILTKMRKLIV